MSKKIKLKFAPANDRGFLRADFKDRNGDAASIQESSLATEECIWLGLNEGTHHHITGDCLARMHLNREQAKAIGFALVRFARNGSLAEPTPEQQLAHFEKCFDEAEQHDRLQTDVSECARAFVAGKATLLQAYSDGHDPAGPYCHDLQGQIADIEKMLDGAVEAINTWLKEHGWEVKGK